MKIYTIDNTTVAFVPVENLAKALLANIEMEVYDENFYIVDMSLEEAEDGSDLGYHFGCHNIHDFDCDVVTLGYCGGGYHVSYEVTAFDDYDSIATWLKNCFVNIFDSFDGKSVLVEMNNHSEQSFKFLSGEE